MAVINEFDFIPKSLFNGSGAQMEAIIGYGYRDAKCAKGIDDYWESCA
jgi:hypothetical protein